MYSQCPDCQTRFRVTADDLRAARGTVRCGRCGSAFDALERLSDTVPPASREVPRLPMVVAQGDAAGTEPALATEYHFTLEDLERVFVEGGKWSELPSSTPAGAAQLPEPPATAEPPVVVDEGPAMEDITLEGERISIEAPPEPAAEEVDLDTTNEVEILRTVPASAAPEEEPTAAQVIELETAPSESALEMVGPQPEPAGAPYAAEPAPVVPAEPRPLSAQRWRRPVEEREEAVAPAPAAARPGALGWALASAALALVLAVQLVHYFRADLARHPQVGPPLRGVYQRLGLALQPHWDVGAIELRQWGNDADAAARGGMAVRASLTNRAAFAQPHPILRLELEDRFGATVATRDFEPADYLKNPSQAARLMAPGASSEAELLLADPGRDAVGYRLDVCLRESPTQLRCASGPG